MVQSGPSTKLARRFVAPGPLHKVSRTRLRPSLVQARASPAPRSKLHKAHKCPYWLFPELLKDLSCAEFQSNRALGCASISACTRCFSRTDARSSTNDRAVSTVGLPKLPKMFRWSKKILWDPSYGAHAALQGFATMPRGTLEVANSERSTKGK